MSRIKRSSGNGREQQPARVPGGVWTALASLLAICLAGIPSAAAEGIALPESAKATESLRTDSSAPPTVSAADGGCRSAVVDSAATVATDAGSAGGVTAASTADAAGAAAAGAGGLRVYIDPETGEFTAPPPGVEIPQIEKPKRAAKRAVEVVPSPVPGGGVMINTQGRFLHSMKAGATESGMEVKCERDISSNGAVNSAGAPKHENEKE